MEKIEIAEIRKQLKAKFPKFKFSVRKNHYFGVRVNLLSGPVDFSEFLDGRVSREFMDGHQDRYDPVIGEIFEVLKTAPAAVGGRLWYDNSDPTTDYFDEAYGISLSVGRDGEEKTWPYICTA